MLSQNNQRKGCVFYAKHHKIQDNQRKKCLDKIKCGCSTYHVRRRHFPLVIDDGFLRSLLSIRGSLFGSEVAFIALPFFSRGSGHRVPQELRWSGSALSCKGNKKRRWEKGNGCYKRGGWGRISKEKGLHKKNCLLNNGFVFLYGDFKICDAHQYCWVYLIKKKRRPTIWRRFLIVLFFRHHSFFFTFECTHIDAMPFWIVLRLSDRFLSKF